MAVSGFPLVEPSTSGSSWTGRPRGIEDGFQAASMVAAEVQEMKGTWSKLAIEYDDSYLFMFPKNDL